MSQCFQDRIRGGLGQEKRIGRMGLVCEVHLAQLLGGSCLAPVTAPRASLSPASPTHLLLKLQPLKPLSIQ